MESLIVKIGSGATAIGIFLAWLALRSNHEWNRRYNALKIIDEWNPRTGEHRKAIEKSLPGIFDIDPKTKEVIELDINKAKNIYECNPNDDHWQLRFHLMEVLNYFEFVSSSYLNGVADSLIIETSLRPPMLKWYKVLRNFIEYMNEIRGYKVWKPYEDVVNLWLVEMPVKRSLTDNILYLVGINRRLRKPS